ncbi:Sensory box/GGDEF family protein [Anaerovibrio sp. JC8]|uniref:putative bifunctional diguanylate cyclase/phosphodiesterase n=1 Tax=Anaerovibrio sp. JC8 TaxID=1240085 RepID=UPI000A0CA963|nr:bifunctional diguanylate cyclase/phosphodiesterase [Anaerovibrio sp. JC8]ORT99847.1 Sensory box/GGDEF family protein [Anaerovibrio sp. JC8]
MHDAHEMRQLFMKRLLGSCYHKVVHVNLRKDSFHILKLDEFERQHTAIDLNKASLSEWFNDFVNSGMCHESVRQRFVEFASPNNLRRLCKKCTEGSVQIVYLRLMGKDGNYQPAILEFFPDMDDNFSGFITVRSFVSSTAISKRNMLDDVENRKHDDGSKYDRLTGLLNRRAFCERADQIMAENPTKKYDIVVSDVVDFKLINEHYGYEAGDKVITEISEWLQCNKGDNFLLGRYGGDQFVTFMEHTGILTDEFIRYIYQSAREVISMKDLVFRLGIYENVDSSVSAAIACDRAIMALQPIKHQYGKLYAFYEDSMLRDLERYRRMEKDMRNSLTMGEFYLVFQPKHNASTGELEGAETLLRWNHAELGSIYPNEFIPIMEDCGFIVEVDMYVWEQTCKCIKRWTQQGIQPVPMSVNFSRLNFREPDFVQRIIEITDRYGIDRSLLHLEITENLFEASLNEMQKTLQACKDNGFKIELDDFGSGYSSLNVLGDLPLDTIKLDKSFMNELSDKKRSNILLGCISLANSLELNTIVEGVESQEQMDMLRSYGANMIQGFYFSKPMSEEDFTAYICKHSQNCQKTLRFH